MLYLVVLRRFKTAYFLEFEGLQHELYSIVIFCHPYVMCLLLELAAPKQHTSSVCYQYGLKGF